MIMNAKERLILISPYLKICDKFKELIEDQNMMKIDIRIIYGKSDLQPEENNWLKQLLYVKTSFYKNLHAKCYLNEKKALITSMNMYEFSQVNNKEMEILIVKENEPELYGKIVKEAQRLIRFSDESKLPARKRAGVIA